MNQRENSSTVTVSIARTVISGREADYEAWIRGITAEALAFPGHMGVNVIRPTPGNSEYVTIFRFEDYDCLRAWEDSPIRRGWLDKLPGIVEGQDSVHKGTGLEFWFSLPQLPTAHPSPHKMALILVAVVFSLVMLLNVLLPPLTGAWPPVAKTFLAVVCQVLLMTYVVMPRVTLALKSWIYNQ